MLPQRKSILQHRKATKMELISCKNVNLSYENKTVLSDLSFAVNAGDYLCVVGENGSGKSTLIKAILALKAVDKGEIHISGGREMRRGIGYLPQQSDAQRDFPASVWEVVLSGCAGGWDGHRPHLFYNKIDKERAMQNMRKLNIVDLKRRSYRELSGGQQQRVLLARMLCAGDKLVLLDEPSTGLDPVASAELYRIVAALNGEGITVIMVTHDIKNAVKNASHILHLQNKPLFFGTAADYLKSDAGRRFGV